MALFKQLLSPLLQVHGVKVSLRPFNKSPPDPHLALSSGYLRLPIMTRERVENWSHRRSTGDELQPDQRGDRCGRLDGRCLRH